MPNDMNITLIATEQIKLSIDNDPIELSRIMTLASFHWYGTCENRQEKLAKHLEKIYSDAEIKGLSTVRTDLLQCILNYVDWEDLAAHYWDKHCEKVALRLAEDQPRDDVGLSDFERNSGIY